MTQQRWRIGVDSGGTFTDVCLADADTGEVAIAKVPSTPSAPDEAIVNGIGQILRGRAAPERPLAEIAYLAHGTTVATNAVIQRAGARTAVITTRGFRDLLELRRQRRPDLYDLQVRQPEPLVGRALRFEVTERLRHDGRVETPLREQDVTGIGRQLRAAGVEAVAVCLLYSYVRPDHELRVRELLQAECPGLFVSLSHEVLPEFREYERLSTVVINSYLGPMISRYLGRLETRLGEAGLTAVPHVTQSNGGVISFGQARELPVRTVLSGPSTGVVGAAHVARLAGEHDLVTLDMGGTSTDVALINGGEPEIKNLSEVDGFPLKAPMVDVNAVGAGGGSIAWVDRGGHLKVGPRSAGADPGPACYGLGTTEPTVTDANVALGRLNPTALLGGAVTVDAGAAHRALERLGAPLGLDATATAEGILRVAVANMAKAARVISVQRGYDLRNYTLVPFGGGGPLHAGMLAAELGVRKVLVPATPGVLSAFGLLVTDLRNDFSRTHLLRLDERGLAQVDREFAELERSAEAWLAAEHVAPADRRLARLADVRYRGQNYELTVSVPGGRLDGHALADIRAGFEAAHQRTYGFTLPEEPIEIVTHRVEASGVIRKAQVRERSAQPAGRDTPATRPVHFGAAHGWLDTPVVTRDDLPTGERRSGPLIVEQLDTTVVIMPEQKAWVDRWSNLTIETATD